MASAVRRPLTAPFGRHRDEDHLALAARLVDELQRHLHAVGVGVVEDRLTRTIERVVGVELPGHYRVGDLLHADGDVHVRRLPGACRARVGPESGSHCHAGTTTGAVGADSCRSGRFGSKRAPAVPSPGGTRQARAEHERARPGTGDRGRGPGRHRGGHHRPAPRPRRGGRRQGALSPRQDLRRRPHHRCAAGARPPRVRRARPAVVRARHRDGARGAVGPARVVAAPLARPRRVRGRGARAPSSTTRWSRTRARSASRCARARASPGSSAHDERVDLEFDDGPGSPPVG